jgi:hypothetical protein
MSNIEQGISNDEVKPVLFFPSEFDIRYSIFCGSLLNFYAACVEVADKDPNTLQPFLKELNAVEFLDIYRFFK